MTLNIRNDYILTLRNLCVKYQVSRSGFFLHHKLNIVTWSWSWFSTIFDIVTMISSWFLRYFSVILPWFFRDLWSESLSWRDCDVIFHQLFAYNRYFLGITSRRDEKPWYRYPGSGPSSCVSIASSKESWRTFLILEWSLHDFERQECQQEAVYKMSLGALE